MLILVVRGTRALYSFRLYGNAEPLRQFPLGRLAAEITV
jgi:hypothetical protein